ncbi:MAG: SemiSWEET transporter [Fusobacterium mortiferum]|nr:SemiSWEET transporter [Fusobacterium mortiferum]
MKIEIIGLIAACLTTSSFLPQVLMVIKTKDTKSISLKMYSIFVIGTALWIFYGLSTNNMPIVLANSIIEMLALIILYYKVKEKKI